LGASLLPSEYLHENASWQAIFTAGYKAVLHIHAVVEECEIMGLLHQIDPKSKKPIRKKILFVKSGAVVVVRIQVDGCDV
jgi:peptide chain release factor subunit 3